MIVLANIYYNLLSPRAQLLLGFLLFYIGCDSKSNQYLVTGYTMGTTYTIKLISSKNEFDTELIKSGIDSLLFDLNKKLSTWDPESEISKFNSWQSVEPYPASDHLLYLIDNSNDISLKTDGLFDITVYELMNLWGFGPNPKSVFPDYDDIKLVLKRSGYDKIQIRDKHLIKVDEKTKIDLNAIAKGYGVDILFDFVKSKGFHDVFIEIGGEIRCSGKNNNNKDWSIGIENPSGYGSDTEKICAILDLDHGAVATSGNYRNIVDLDGEILGHTINPKTGYPIQTDVISVTVLSESCMRADAWATALMTMDYNKGFEKVNSETGVDAVWVLRDVDSKKIYLSKSSNIQMKNLIYPIK
tara:strand:+ start:151 stop:1218 length:1068 start_codon:yes stop_codon:yes gene_type:complete